MSEPAVVVLLCSATWKRSRCLSLRAWRDLQCLALLNGWKPAGAIVFDATLPEIAAACGVPLSPGAVMLKYDWPGAVLDNDDARNFARALEISVRRLRDRTLEPELLDVAGLLRELNVTVLWDPAAIAAAAVAPVAAVPDRKDCCDG